MDGVTNQLMAERRKQAITTAVGNVSLKFMESAAGAILRDVEGREYIDFAGGIGTMNVGHSHPKVVAAIKAQAEKLTHTCFMVNPYASAVELAEKLCRLTPGDFPKKAVFLNSGAEAVENAVKVARYTTKRQAIIVFDNGYHGRTLLTMTMTTKVNPFKMGFGPFAPEVYRLPFADTSGPEKLYDSFVRQINPESVAAVVAEPVQGEGGFVAPPSGYFQEVSRICRDNGILFIMDEIQSGMGRTGRMFASEHWQIEPDLIVVGKSLAAGMPLAAVVGKSEIMDAVHVGGLGGTYGGNPVACAAALAVLEIFESESMLEKSRALGNKLRSRFEKWQKKYSLVGDIRGLGAMLGFELVKGPNRDPATDEARELVSYCNENGLVLLVCGIYGNVVRCLAPFVITDQQLEKGFSILEAGLEHIHQ
ncbi:MAG: 4-aminobutyrate--2-oxoglutarate transaminase [Deltaproteobacteria bacterium]|nr:4-aminobutyrate--2-oxoglutarate transaminase [Deltaproteobacteria bacterium]MBW2070057.1 4-aminobutyrate--2-oxoglutarate transaminase [Deltaproteobacteria bacterium]